MIEKRKYCSHINVDNLHQSFYNIVHEMLMMYWFLTSHSRIIFTVQNSAYIEGILGLNIFQLKETI